MVQLTQERPADGPAIEMLLDQAFGGDRGRKTSYRFRRSVAPLDALSRVARDDGGDIVGTIRYWPIVIGPDRVPALLLGPLAVRAGWRGAGLGGRLIETTLAAASAAGHRRVLLVGDLVYYHRFGFVPAGGWGIAMPGERSERLLLKPLVEDAFAGIAGEIQAARRPARRRAAPAARPAPVLPLIRPLPAQGLS